MNSPTIRLLETRIRKALARDMLPLSQYERLVRQLKIMRKLTGETLEQITGRLS
jgi:hypothetical protein